MPNSHLVEIAEAKVAGYLLNSGHPDGASKAAFFCGLGYSQSDWQRLRRALAELAHAGLVRAIKTTRHGVKYIVDGELKALRGGSATLRTIWIIDNGSEVPRLVTAYPMGDLDDERA